jgi:FkbM family methyltransferase
MISDITNRVRGYLYRSRLFYPLAKWFKAKITAGWKLQPSHWIAFLIKENDAQIVQIGSNNGKSGDPIYRLIQQRKGWKGLFVEPVPYLFHQLKANYGNNPRFKFENSVINQGESVSFYWVNPKAKECMPNLPSWYDQLGSFNKSHITSLISGIEPFIEETSLNGISINSLLSKHDITSIDLLHIDTEGYDYKILSQLDLQKFRPRIILYERKHLSSEEATSAIKFLKPFYQLYNLGGDTIAVQEDAGKHMEKCGLKPVICD